MKNIFKMNKLKFRLIKKNKLLLRIKKIKINKTYYRILNLTKKLTLKFKYC